MYLLISPYYIIMQHQPNAFSVIKIVHIGLLVGMAMFDIVSLIIVLQGVPVIR